MNSPQQDGASGQASPIARGAPGLDELTLRAARSSCTILITGETGVGKGHLAKQLHRESPRSKSPFVPVNCGAIPETIIDSQLFGHARGAFTGASSEHLGLVRAAEGGTLFLDEVGELPPSAQTRLLRLLQDREVQPVGHARPIIVDVRVMAATNSDLRRAVETKAFREDLLFRLDVVRLHLKPLRDRLDELELLLRLFNAEFAELYDQDELEFNDDAMAMLRTYRWPGNIRQLRTLVERLHVLCPGEVVDTPKLIEIGHLNDLAEPANKRSDEWPSPESRASGGAERSGRPCLEAVRYEELQRVLDETGGSVTEAAAVFGVHRSTIYRWLQSYGERSGSEESGSRRR